MGTKGKAKRVGRTQAPWQGRLARVWERRDGLEVSAPAGIGTQGDALG